MEVEVESELELEPRRLVGQPRRCSRKLEERVVEKQRSGSRVDRQRGRIGLVR